MIPDLTVILAELSELWTVDVKSAQRRCREILTEHKAYITADDARRIEWRDALVSSQRGPRGVKLITIAVFNRVCNAPKKTVSQISDAVDPDATQSYLIEGLSEPYISDEVVEGVGTVCTPIVRSHVQGDVIYHAIERVRDLVQPMSFYVAVVESIKSGRTGLMVMQSGIASRHIVRWVQSKDGEGRFCSVWDGSIDVTRTWLAYEISSSRRLISLEWSKYVELETVSSTGLRRVTSVPVMAIRQTEAKASWIDAAGLSLIPNIRPIKHYVFIKAGALKTEGKAICGQGPYITEDGVRVFAAKSMILDEHGEIDVDTQVDLSGLTAALRYYDVTPTPDEEKILLGISLFRKMYSEIPSLPSIPATMLGALYSACLPALSPEWFSAIQFSGMHGSGKTMLSQRFDCIQSRDVRILGKGSAAKPVLNLGVTNGTAKGPSYRIKNYAGFFISSDDALKKGATDFQINTVSNIVSDMIRSLESGAAALGRVDRSTNRVVSGEAGQLYSSMRITSELPFTGESTVERMIALPFLDRSWADGLFNTELSIELSKPEAIEAMHHAWSALTRWIWTRQGDAMDAHREACAITQTWTTSARTQGNYSAVVGGNLLFREWCDQVYGINVTEIDDAIAALKVCAEMQAVDAEREDLKTVVLRTLREYMTDKKICVVGEAVNTSREWCDPFYADTATEDEDADDETPRSRNEWPNPLNITRSQIGLRMEGTTWKTSGSIIGYLKMPKPRGRGNPNGYVWLNNEKLGVLRRVLVKNGLINDCTDADFKTRLINEGVGSSDKDGGSEGKRDRSLRIHAEMIWPTDESEN